MNQFKLNSCVQLIMCRCFKKSATVAEELHEKGVDRTERNLDVRNLVKSQEVLKSLMHLTVPSKEQRKLLRLQRRALVLEPGEDSEDSEDNFYKYRPFVR